MQFEDLTKEQVAEYATRTDYLSQMVFQAHPSRLVELMGDIGLAKATADKIEAKIAEAEMAMAIGLISHDTAHDDLVVSIQAAAASVRLSFETVLDAVAVYIHTYNHCNCPRCIQRRQVKVADHN